jgi:hypothetical protein
MAVQPLLKRFDITVLKNKTISDAAQVPAAATINFYRAGASASANVSIPDQSMNPDPQPVTIPVYTMGTIAVGDTVQADIISNALLSVAAVDATALTVSVINNSGQNSQIFAGQRLVRRTNPPQAYRDPLGNVAIGSSITTDSATGRAACYIKEYRYDYVVTFASTVRVYADAEGSFVMR